MFHTTELADALEELRAYGADVDPLERQLACDLLAKLRESVALGVVTRMASATTAHTRGNPVDDEPLTVADLPVSPPLPDPSESLGNP